MYLDRGAEGPTTNRLASAFSTALALLAEVVQDQGARIMMRVGGLSFARLDRIHTTMITQDMLDHCPRSGTSWAIADLRVHLSLATWASIGLQGMPAWIAQHPHFVEVIDQTLDIDGLSDDILNRVEEVRQVLRYAAQEVREFMSDKGAKTYEEKVSCFLLVLLGDRCGDTQKARRG
eukprot:4872053-Pyramimonas_sp.AAC.1